MNMKQRAASLVLSLSVLVFMVCAPVCGALAVEPAPAEADESAQSDFMLVLIPYGWLTGFTGTLGVNAHCKGTHHVHAKVTHLWGLCARTQSGVLTRGGREA